jgi:kinesin family protein C1
LIVLELETSRVQLNANNASLQKEIDTVKAAMTTSSLALEEVKRRHDVDIDDLRRKYRNDFDQAIREAEEEARRRDRQYADDLREIKRKAENDLEDEQNARRREVHALSSEIAKTQQGAELQVESKQKALRDLADELATAKAETERVRQDGLEAEDRLRAEIEREKLVQQDLKTKLSEAAATTLNLESSLRSAQARVAFLESDCKSQSQAFADLEQKTQDAVRAMEVAQEKLRVEETLRRKLHNQVQELKGNIRVFCRVRPPLFSEPEEDHARITFPDEQDDAKEVEITGPEEKSSLGKITTKKHPFSFDRVFGTGSQNKEIFDEISQLVQSALDGYNVCIFCYGQTGAGKTYTMSSEDGMIPRAVNQIYDTAKSLEEKGWAYTMEGSFVEVYNENINDLLGKADDFDKKKHEIRHDMQKMKTTITDITTVALDSPNKVESILKRAMNNRSVAATKANERSSRSHSVFILTLNGTNSITGETSSGTLNLVDLAGSERLSQSGATGERLKETQNINKSLSCLGDVIGALGQQGKGGEVGHIPYRNSKLTYLLQFSLGGNSKTLMFVMISPLGRHLGETLTSLKFATKVRKANTWLLEETANAAAGAQHSHWNGQEGIEMKKQAL